MIKVISYYLLNFQLWKFKSFLLKSKYNRIERELYKQEDGQSYRMLFIEFPMMKFRIFKSFLLRRNIITKWLNDQEDDGTIKAVTKINQGVASRFLRIISKQSILVIEIGRQIEGKHNFSHSVVRTMKNPVRFLADNWLRFVYPSTFRLSFLRYGQIFSSNISRTGSSFEERGNSVETGGNRQTWDYRSTWQRY